MVKKTIYIFIILGIIISCKNKEKEKNVYYYPTLTVYKRALKKTFIKLDTVQSFKALLHEIDVLACDNKTPVVIFENENSIFNLIPRHECSTADVVSCPRMRNEVIMRWDSIVANHNSNYVMDSLNSIVNKHIRNENKEFGYSDSPKMAFFSIQKDSLMTLEKVNEILLDISLIFNKINKDYGDSIPLNIFIGKESIIEIKPPKPINRK